MTTPDTAASDPTHGRIDRDIQQMVDGMHPKSLGQRVAMENTLQARREDAYDHAELEVNPRWRDWHTLPDRWLYDRLHAWLRKHPRLMKSRPSKALHRYAGRFWCHYDGQCIFRDGHRGGCSWGGDEDD